jgi:ubiquinone/menaquinone biosynthesis C-methylase UbiE
MANEKMQTEKVKKIFNDMVDEYDHLYDLWYRYTFGSIDAILSIEFWPSPSIENKPVALDIGCGTGVQSLRLASMGYKVIGVDVADKLLTRAKTKLSEAGHSDAQFFIADAQWLPFEDNVADCMNCCGPTLSFVHDWRKALMEMSRCLKPGGKLLLEVEGKWNMDLFWEIINALGFDFLDYNEPLSTAIGHLLPPWSIGHIITYPFKLESGEPVSMHLKLFAARELTQELLNVDLVKVKRWGLHVITNLIPSTVLHETDPSSLLRQTFRALSFIEKRINSSWPFNALGCSLLVLACKKKPQTKREGEKSER